MFVQIIINLEIGHAFEVNYPPPKKKNNFYICGKIENKSHYSNPVKKKLQPFEEMGIINWS